MKNVNGIAGLIFGVLCFIFLPTLSIIEVLSWDFSLLDLLIISFLILGIILGIRGITRDNNRIPGIIGLILTLISIFIKLIILFAPLNEYVIVGINTQIPDLLNLSSELWVIILRSLRTSLSAVFLAAVVALPIGTYLGLRDFRGKKSVTNLINTFMGFPPVVLGLLLFLILSRSGPLGPLALVHTTTAMIIAQFLLAIPIIMGTGKAAIESVDPALKETIISLGANESQLWWELIKHSKKSIIAGLLVAFGQAISEVGAVSIVGGAIPYKTNVFTTAIVQLYGVTNYGTAIVLGIILLSISFIVNYSMTRLLFGD